MTKLTMPKKKITAGKRTAQSRIALAIKIADLRKRIEALEKQVVMLSGKHS